MSKHPFISTAAALVALACAMPALAVSPLLKEFEDAFVRLGEEVRPCVVEIRVTGKRIDRPNAPGLDDFFRRFFPRPNGQDDPPAPHPEIKIPRTRSTGSGFIYNNEGYIVTNNHVVSGAESIRVSLWDGMVYDARVVGMDPDTDLAVVKIDVDRDLPVARLGDSEGLKIGMFAIAMGSPSGLEGSLSFGHISGLGREELGLDRELRFRGFIQTDAAINLGNSGGPLCNIDGEVIGINIAIVWGANSLGFAIPVNRAKEIIPDLIAHGKVVRGYLGVQISDLARVATDAGVPNVDEFAVALGLPDSKGAYVALDPKEETPASKAGLRQEDVIRQINGHTLRDANDLVKIVSAYKPGDTIEMEVWREGKNITLSATLAIWPGMHRASLGPPVLGMYIMTLAEEIAAHIAPDKKLQGVLVREIEEGSPAAENIVAGDIILRVAYQDLTTTAELRDLVKQNGKPGKVLLFKVFRLDKGEITVGVRIPKKDD